MERKQVHLSRWQYFIWMSFFCLSRCTELEEKLCMQKKELAKLGQIEELVKRISLLESELKDSNEICEKIQLENNELKAKQANGDFVNNNINVSNEFPGFLAFFFSIFPF